MSFLSQTNLACMCDHKRCCEKEGAGVARFRNRCEILESQLAAANAEILRLSGKTGFCAECEEQARLLGKSGSREAKLIAELQAAEKWGKYIWDKLAAAKAEIEKINLWAGQGVNAKIVGPTPFELMESENKRLREALKVADCPSCPNQGWYEHNGDQVQCE